MTAEGLLRNAETFEYSNIITIDGKSRAINIPLGEEFFGVEGDVKVERKYFSCPKVVGDNIDLSECNIYINYILSDKEGNPKSEDVESYFCDDLSDDGDNIKFTWVLSERVLAEDGYIAFAVVAKKSIDGVLKNRWYTTPGVGIVKKTIKDGEELQQQFPDVIDNLINRVHDIEMFIGSGGTGGGGATEEQIKQIETNKEDIQRLSEEKVDQVTFKQHTENGDIHVTANDKQAWNKVTDKVDKTGITLDKHTDGLIYIFVDGIKVGNGVEVTGEVVEGDVIGTLDENNNILLSGELADGTYTLKYQNEDGTYTDIGSLVVGAIEPDTPVEPVKNYFDVSTAILNNRLGSSGSPSNYNGMFVTDYIPWEDAMSGKVFKIEGISPCVSTAYNYYGRVCYYDVNKNFVTGQNANDESFYSNGMTTTYGNYTGGGFIRISLVVKDNVQITENDVANLKIILE